jgi:DNA-binding transcriptional regulator YiaG
MHQYKECSLSNVKLLSGYEIHETPYGKSVTITDIKSLHKLIGLELITKPGLLCLEEIRFLRKERGLSQKLLAQTLGVAEITVRGWERGKAKISGPADRLLRVLYKDYADPDSLARKLVDQLSRLDAQVQKARKQLRFGVAGNVWVRQQTSYLQKIFFYWFSLVDSHILNKRRS